MKSCKIVLCRTISSEVTFTSLYYYYRAEEVIHLAIFLATQYAKRGKIAKLNQAWNIYYVQDQVKNRV